MYEIMLDVSIEDEFPRVNIKLEDKSSIKETILKSQIKKGLGEVFLNELSSDKDSLDKVHGFYITRKISSNNNLFENSHIRLVALDQNNKIEFSFLDDDSIKNYDIPTIASLAKEYNAIAYNVSYFNFPSNLISKSNIKIEEEIIYNYYARFKKTPSSSIVKNIAKSIKENALLNELPKQFYEAFSKTVTETSVAISNNNNQANFLRPSFNNRLLYNQKFYVLEIFGSDVREFDFDIKNIKVTSNNAIIKNIIFESNKAKPLVLENSLYFNLLSKTSYSSMQKSLKDFEIKIYYRVYNKNTINIVSTKEITFYM